MATKLQSEGREATPGWKIYRSCYDEVVKEPDSTASKQWDNEVAVLQEEINCSHEKERLDESLSLIGFKTHGLHVSTKVKAARVKLERSFQAQTEMAATSYNIDKGTLSRDKETLQKPNELDQLHNLIKEKLAETNLKTREKIQVLTIAPESCSRTKIASLISVSTWWEKPRAFEPQSVIIIQAKRLSAEKKYQILTAGTC